MNTWAILAIIFGAYVLADIIADTALIIALKRRGFGLADIAMSLRNILSKDRSFVWRIGILFVYLQPENTKKYKDMELSQKVLNCMNQSDLQDDAHSLYATETSKLIDNITDVVDTLEREGVEIPESLVDLGIAFTEKQQNVISALQEQLKVKYALMKVIASVAIDNKPKE